MDREGYYPVRIFSILECLISLIGQCENIISSNTLLFLIGDALTHKSKPFSIVRMADGEHLLMDRCNKEPGDKIVESTSTLGTDWMKKFGIDGISYGELKFRMLDAANNCTYFAASLSGIIIPNYNVFYFSGREKYADNFFTYAWTDEYKKAIYKKAGKVLIINNDESYYKKIKLNAEYNDIDLDLHYLKLSSWRDCDSIIKTAVKDINPRLTLFSAGPAGKYIGPRIADANNSVTLDIGNGMGRWLIDGIPRGSGELIDILH